ncbi:hypothetical protein MY4038_009923 [Beauveria bassiana]
MKLFVLILFSAATLVAALAPPISPGQAAAATVGIGNSPRLSIYSYLQARSKIDENCTEEQKKKIKEALSKCRKIAQKAAKAARTGKAERLETYFKTSEPKYREKIAELYENIEKECERGERDDETEPLTIICDDAQSVRCSDNTVAYSINTALEVHLCPEAFERPISPEQCGDRSLAGVLIHEFSHQFPWMYHSIGDARNGYGRYNSAQLTRDTALANADTYQWFAIDTYMNCPAPTSPPTPQNELPSTSRECPADQDRNLPQHQFPDISLENVLSWARGEFLSFSCTSIIAFFTCQRKEPRALEEDDCQEAQRLAASYIQTQRQSENMDFAQDLVQKQKVPEPCKKIKNIEIGFTLSSSWLSIKGEGTKDDVVATLEGPAGKAELLLASQPSGGYSKWIPLDMQKSFKTDSIDITGINKLTLTAETFFLRGGSSDAFKVQDLRLRAKCADPGFGAKNDKYVGINAWYERPQMGGLILNADFFPSNYDKKNLATFPVVPADWEFAPPCASFKELSYDFAFGNTNGGGTGDTLVLKLGEGKIPLGKSFTAGTSTKGTVDLKKTFKKKVVQLSELETVAFDDDNSTAGFGDNGWTFKGVTFTATCADVPKKLQMNKYSNVNADIYAAGNKEPWSGKLIPSDWIELKERLK